MYSEAHLTGPLWTSQKGSFVWSGLNVYTIDIEKISSYTCGVLLFVYTS